METVEIVIRLKKERYDELQKNKHLPNRLGIEKAITDGTVLPKGHGRLIDSNVLWDAFQDLGQDFYEAFDFAEANAVMEADEEVNNG